MKATILVIGIVWVLVLIAAAGSPWSERLLPQLGTVLAIGLAAWAGFFFIAKKISSPRGASGAESREGPPTAAAWAPRNLAILLLLFFAAEVWLRASSGSGSFVLVEGGYYCLLFFAGYFLRRSGRSGQYVGLGKGRRYGAGGLCFGCGRIGIFQGATVVRQGGRGGIFRTVMYRLLGSSHRVGEVECLGQFLLLFRGFGAYAAQMGHGVQGAPDHRQMQAEGGKQQYPCQP